MHESAVLHFDLSHLDPDQPYTLQVGAARHALQVHTPGSLELARRSNRALGLLPDERVTHHTGPVRLPSEALVLLRVCAPARADEPLDRLVLVSLHRPRGVRLAGVRERRTRSATPLPLPPKIRARVDASTGLPVPDDRTLVDADEVHTTHDTAEALVFHHGELLTTQPRPADRIVTGHIREAGGINTLAQSISDQAAEHERDPSRPSWVSSRPGAALEPGAGRPSIYVWSDRTLDDLRAPLRGSLRTTKDDPALELQCWTATPGVVRTPMEPAAPGRPGATPATNYTIRDRTPLAGVEHEFSYDPVTRIGTINLKNSFVRWLQVAVDQEGQKQEPITSDKLVGVVSPVTTIMAIPVAPDWSPYSFTFDDAASRAVISLGGLGLPTLSGRPGEPPWDVAYEWAGVLLTAFFEYGVPMVFIALGVAVDQVGAKWTDLIKSVASMGLGLLESLVEGMLPDLFSGFSLVDVLSTIANGIASVFWNILDDAAFQVVKAFIGAAVGESAVEEATPFLGWAALAVGALADLADMAETTVEVGQSFARMVIRVDRTMDLEVTVDPDPDHHGQDGTAQWPTTATHYTIVVTYTDGTLQYFTAPFSPVTHPGPITHVFEGLPAGGQIVVSVHVLAATGWLAGQGTSKQLDALPPTDENLLRVRFPIVEREVPLTSRTRYSMAKKLVVENGRRTWAVSPPAPEPTGTVSDLDTSNVGHHLGELGGLTYDDARAVVGYAWKASGQGLPIVGTDEPYAGQEYVAQVLGADAEPESGLRRTSHGRTIRPCLAFPPATLAHPTTAAGFLLDPDPTDSTTTWLRAVSSSPGTPFVASPGRAFGRFLGPQDDLEIHPAGYAVALDRTWAKIQVLRLPDADGPDAEAPVALMYAGRGSRAGLLADPVALGCSRDTIIVLEQARTGFGATLPHGGLAAFDVRGNPVPAFGGRSSVPLRAESSEVRVVDLAVEAAGYVYVVKYLDHGTGHVDPTDYRLDIYAPSGEFLAQTAGLAAARLVVDLWRNVVTLNYEVLAGTGGTEPSIAQWIPSTPTPQALFEERA